MVILLDLPKYSIVNGEQVLTGWKSMGWFTKESNTSNEDTMLLKALNRSQAVIEFTPSGNILTANDNFLRVMGYNLEEIQGQHHRLFVDAKEASSSEYKRFWQRLSAGEYIANEFRRVDKSGEDVWIKHRITPL